MKRPNETKPCGKPVSNTSKALANLPATVSISLMFTIEHEFDATVITMVDDGETPLQEDVIVSAFEECITVEQHDPRTGRTQKITLSLAQMRDLGAALDLPEGAYILGPAKI